MSRIIIFLYQISIDPQIPFKWPFQVRNHDFCISFDFIYISRFQIWLLLLLFFNLLIHHNL